MSTKFSQFASGGTIGVGSKIAGLDASVTPDNRIFDFPGLGILDTNGSVLLGWSQPLSGTAVNYLEFQNALSGNPVVISALGGDIDVGLYLTTQNNGDISFVPGPAGFTIAAGTSAFGVPSGTTAQRPVSGLNGGYLRYNSDVNGLEYYNSAIVDWTPVGTGMGSVSSVTSADNARITIGGTAVNPTVNISAVYAGQATITTVGILSSGSLATGFTPVPGEIGGTGVANTGKTITLGGNLATVGAFSSTFTMTNTTTVTFPTTGTLATTAQAPSALPVPLSEGGTNANLTASNGGIFYSTATAGAILAGTATAGTMLMSGASGAPTWSTATWPSTVPINQVLYASSANVVGSVTAANSAVLVSSSAGVPAWTGTLTNGQVVLGSTGATPVAASITGNSGVTITNGAGSLAVSLVSSVSGRNLLFNGGMNVWQRGTSFAPTTYLYGPDRWQCGAGLASCSFSQVFDTATNGYLVRLQRNNGGGSVADIKIVTSLTRDMSVKVRSNVLTLSFVATAGSGFTGAGGAMKVEVVTGETAGSDSSLLTGWTNQTDILNTTQVISTTRTRYTFTTTAAAVGVTQVGVLLGFTPVGTAGASDFMQITEVQLEVSPTASNYQVMSYQQELQRCQYFYQRIRGGCGYGIPASNGVQIALQFFQVMRISPITSSTAAMTVTDAAANYIQSTVSIASLLTESGGIVLMNALSGITPFRPYSLNTSGFSESITLDAELY